MYHVNLKRVKFFDMKLSLLYDLPDITDLFVTRTQKKTSKLCVNSRIRQSTDSERVTVVCKVLVTVYQCVLVLDCLNRRTL